MSLGIVAILPLTILPGAWLTFGLPLKGLSFWLKLIIGVVLTPLVVAAQFYLIRLIGIPFEPTSIILVVVNLPVLYLIIRQREKLPLVERKVILAASLIFLIILVAIAPFLLDPQKRLFTWEAWSQADVSYSLANGGLDLQDAELAGIRLSYPWIGQVYQAVRSYLANTPPVTNYIWENLAWLICIFGLTAAIIGELGGGQLAQVSGAISLSFGVNFIGMVVQPLIPLAWIKAHPILGSIWGDNRYTPWLDKLVFFGQMYFGMGLFIAILYLVIKHWPDGAKRYYLALLGLLLCGLALIYPVLIPPACILIGARGLMLLLRQESGRAAPDVKEVLALGAVTVIGLALTFAYTRFLTQERAGTSLVNLHDLRTIRWRLIESVVVTSPLLLGLVLSLRKMWSEKRGPLMILGLGTLGSVALYSLFDVPWWQNEYKFIFTAAICLAPFAGLALEPLLKKAGTAAVPLLTVLTVVLALPWAYNLYEKTYDLYTRPGPLMDVSHFDLRLDDRDPLSGLMDAIRLKTPTNSLVVLASAELHYPTITRRQLFVAPFETNPDPGVLITSDEMLTQVKGYPGSILQERRATIKRLFESQDPAQMAQALDEILQFNRPAALVFDEQLQVGLHGWLVDEQIGTSLYQGDGHILWLVEPLQSTLAQLVNPRGSR
jgi:hypothetical protein